MSMHLNIFILFCMLSISYSMMTGGWTPVSDDNPDAHEHAKFAARKISASTNNLYHMKVTNVSNIRRQVVSGLNYKMTITLAPTECKKNQNVSRDEIENCPLLLCKAPLSCNVNLWVQAWLKEDGTKLTKSTCTPLPVDSNC
ncbi:cystatin-1 [Parasteatoda tepidariorum]|uniref:Cystatin-like protein n=1 Tax=Parasteatoda tepidariorum TaxID=114398 RepID=A0A2L2XVT1_PARTP|nr:cystatin-1 [Parasteatoda tepidariorum]